MGFAPLKFLIEAIVGGRYVAVANTMKYWKEE